MQAEAASKNEHSSSRIGVLTSELEEARQNLQKSREEINLMSKRIQILKEELEETKKELKQLKAKQYYQKQPVNPEIEDLKFVETASKADQKEQQGKRYVKFASPPSLLAKEVDSVSQEEMGERKKNRKKTVMPLMGWLSRRNKGCQEREAYSPIKN